MLTRTLGGPARAAEKEQANEVLRSPSGDQQPRRGSSSAPESPPNPSTTTARRESPPRTGDPNERDRGFDRSANHQ